MKTDISEYGGFKEYCDEMSDLFQRQQESHNTWHCGKCGEGYRPQPDYRCNCREPMAIHIPPGQHVHVQCPAHGDRKIYGDPITW